MPDFKKVMILHCRQKKMIEKASADDPRNFHQVQCGWKPRRKSSQAMTSQTDATD